MSGKRRWSEEEKLKIVIEGLNPAWSSGGALAGGVLYVEEAVAGFGESDL